MLNAVRCRRSVDDLVRASGSTAQWKMVFRKQPLNEEQLERRICINNASVYLLCLCCRRQVSAFLFIALVVLVVLFVV